MDRVKWFWERSARNRLREEKEILEEEMKHTVRSFSHLRGMWKTLADRSNTPGEASYAHKQAAMFERFESDSDKLCVKALEKCSVYEKWYVPLDVVVWTLNDLSNRFTTTIEGSMPVLLVNVQPPA